MRSKNAFKNLIFYIVYEVLVFVLGIVFPRLIILTYGSEINGLTSTITRVLSLINLIQAGAVGAAIFQMYKPVAENDFETQSAIIYSSKKFYRIVSAVYLASSLAVGLFYSFYLADKNLAVLEIFLSFLILSVNGANALLFNSICDIYISSHQKRYLLSISFTCEQFVRYTLLLVVIVFKAPFVFIYLCYLFGGLVSVFLNTLFYHKLSKNTISKKPINRNFVIPNRKYLMLSSIGSEMITASPAIIITTFIGLAYSSVFSVYSMVFTSMKTLLNSIQLSFSAIFGNLTKTSSEDKIFRTHSAIELLTIFLGTIASCCVAFLIVPFIKIYTFGADMNYLYTTLAIFVVVYVVVFSFRTSFGYVATVYGLFKYTCIIVMIFACFGVVLSILLTILFGLPYVMVGLIVNQLGCSIAILIVLKRKIPWFRCSKLFIRAGLMVALVSLTIFLYFALQPKIDSWIQWIIYGVIVFSISFIVLISYCLLFERPSLSLLLKHAKTIFKK